MIYNGWPHTGLPYYQTSPQRTPSAIEYYPDGSVKRVEYAPATPGPPSTNGVLPYGHGFSTCSSYSAT